jgi:cell division septation protein DedD
MREVIDVRDVEPVQPKRDFELTLGFGMLLGLFLGLVLLCGACFGLGLVVGHRDGRQAPSTDTAAAGAAASPLAGAAQSKPSAGPPAAASQAAATGADLAALPDAASNPDSSAAAPEAGSTAAGLSEVRPAVTVPIGATPGQAQVQQAGAVASTSAASWMVQIASVAHADDAEVLIHALNRRGYAVTAQREAGDGMYHVRIGPFLSRSEADQWRQKLIGDGYNAMVQIVQ